MSISRLALIGLIAAGCAHAPVASPPASSPSPEENPPAAVSSSRLDPSEEITPEELAGIPDPVPASQEAPESPSQGPCWQVQVLSTADPALARKTAQDASRALGVSASVENAASQYKVRLGSFRSEAEAQELRDRAVRAGFPGAFRVRCTSDPTLKKP